MGSEHELVSRRCHSHNQTPFCVMLVANASHHLQQKAEQGTSGAFCRPLDAFVSRFGSVHSGNQYHIVQTLR